MEKGFFRTRDNNGNYHNLSDVVGCVIATDENGFKTADLQLKRDYDEGRGDLGLNNELLIGVRNSVMWNGRIEGITAQPAQGQGQGQGSVGATANGYWASTLDLPFAGTVSTSATPQAMIASFLNSTYLPQLSTSSASLLTTGLTAQKYVTGNNGSDNEYIGDIIKAICGFGYSASSTVRVVPAVWENRVLATTLVKTVTPDADYIVRKKNITVGGLRRSLSNVINRVIVRYKDATGTLVITAYNDTASQAALKAYLGSGTVSYIRSQVLDWTGQGNLTATIVGNRAAAILNDSKQVKTDTDSIEISRDYSVYSVADGAEIPNWKVRAGKWLKIPDRMPRGSSSASGTSSGDVALSSYYYISQTSYDCFTGQLTITPEKSSTVADFIA